MKPVARKINGNHEGVVFLSIEPGTKSLGSLLPCQYPNILVKPDQPAPDFEAEAYYRGGQITVKLSDFQNQWVVLFFYASDFTFV